MSCLLLRTYIHSFSSGGRLSSSGSGHPGEVGMQAVQLDGVWACCSYCSCCLLLLMMFRLLYLMLCGVYPLVICT